MEGGLVHLKLSCHLRARLNRRRKYLGRASEAGSELEPMVERIPPTEEHFEEQECRFWFSLSPRLNFLSTLSKRE